MLIFLFIFGIRSIFGAYLIAIFDRHTTTYFLLFCFQPPRKCINIYTRDSARRL